MKQNLHIRRSIARYYEGTSTPAEFDEVVRYFETAATVEADLEADKALFLELGALAGSDVEVPESLSRSLEAIGEEPKSDVRHARIMRVSLFGAAASAAAIVMLVAFGRSTVPAGSDERQMADAAAEMIRPAESAAVVVDSSASTSPSAAENFVAEPQTEIDAPSAAPKRKVRVPATRRKKSVVPQREQMPDDRERSGALRTVELLNRSLSKANIACSDVEETFKEIDEKLNNLQK